MILPPVPDTRLVTIRRGGTLTDDDHHLLALWAATCAEHVLPLFEAEQPDDARPREAIEHARAWTRGEVRMMAARAAGGHAMGAARNLRGAARFAAYSAGQAAVERLHPEEESEPREARAGIVTFAPGDSTAVVAALAARGVDVSDKVGRVIVSPHFYNAAEDVDRLAEALRDVLAAAPAR